MISACREKWGHRAPFASWCQVRDKRQILDISHLSARSLVEWSWGGLWWSKWNVVYGFVALESMPAVWTFAPIRNARVDCARQPIVPRIANHIAVADDFTAMRASRMLNWRRVLRMNLAAEPPTFNAHRQFPSPYSFAE